VSGIVLIKSGQFIDHSGSGLRVVESGFCEVGQQSADGFVMRRTGHPVDANGEGVFFHGLVEEPPGWVDDQ